jgi:hypothetical protein
VEHRKRKRKGTELKHLENEEDGESRARSSLGSGVFSSVAPSSVVLCILIVLIFSFIFLKITKTFSVCLMGKRPGPNVKHSAYTLQQVGVLNFFCKIFAAD